MDHRAPITLLALLSAPAAFAGQTLSGDHITAYYDDNGMWGNSSSAAALEVTDGTSTADVIHPGTVWNYFRVEYSQAVAGAGSYYATSQSSAEDLTVVSENDLSSGTELTSAYEWTAGDLDIVKAETWDEADQVLTVSFQITNTGTEDMTDLRFIYAFDPDTDYDAHSSYSTLNDVMDLSGDGLDDWAQAVGPSSDWTVGFASCDPSTDEFGFNGSWYSSSGQDADLTLSDPDAASADSALYWRNEPGSLFVGDTITLSTVFVFDTTEAGAQALAVSSDATDACEACDADGDGFMSADCGGDDCDDTDATVHPDADEICDGVDNDCDGDIDDADTDVDLTTGSTWYADSDTDGYGDPATTTDACDQPSGYVSDDQDCDDSDIAVNPDATEICDGVDNDCNGDTDDADAGVDLTTGTTWYADTDADGYGDASSSTDACDEPSGFVADDTDCDDTAVAVNPGAQEVCNGIDDDCDGLADDLDSSVDLTTGATFYADSDSDGFGDAAAPLDACDAPSGYVVDDQDCDDTTFLVNPDAQEVCNDIDDDCDALVDDADDSLDTSTGTTFYGDADEDGYGAPDQPVDACEQPEGTSENGDDCDDGEATTYPGADDTWYDGVDSDCAGDDDDDADADGVSVDEDCDDADPDINPGAEDIPDDGIDQDCDGEDATTDDGGGGEDGDVDGDEDDDKGDVGCAHAGAETPLMVGAMLGLVGLAGRRRRQD